jgi:tricorn protease
MTSNVRSRPLPATARRLAAAALAVVLPAAAAAAPAGAQPHAGLLRDPDVSATHVAFRYADDLWLVPREGGVATPLASPPGEEINPRFSPDGSTLAFVANYDGDADLYTVPVAGGVPFRVTHQPGWQVLSDWAPDGRLIYFTASRHGLGARSELFTVAAEGGMPRPLPVPYGTEGAISADGRWLAYVPNTTRYYRDWKRYVGGTAADVWLFGLEDHAWRAATDWIGTDTTPMWHGGRLYFLSDAGPGHRRNLWTYDPASGERRQLTHHADDDVRSPAIGPGPDGGGEIVYAVGRQLRLLDLPTLAERSVEVRVPGARPRLRTAPVDVGGGIVAFSPSPRAERVAVEARGDVWTLPAAHGTPRNLTRTSGVAERDPAWSPDGRWIAFFSDRSGEYQLHVIAADGRGGERQLTDRSSGFLHSPRWSPDSRHVLFQDNAGGLWLQALAGGEARRVATDPWARQPAAASWSADSRWLAFDLAEPVGADVRSLWLYEVEPATLHRATSALADERLPAFDRAGEHLYYVARRAFDLETSDVEQAFVHRDTQVLVALALRADVESPHRPRSDEAAVEGAAAEASGDGGDGDGDDEPRERGGESAPRVTIDLDGLERRAERLPVAPGSFESLAVDAEGRLLYLRTSGGGVGDEPRLQLFDPAGEDAEEATVAEKVRVAALAAAGEAVATRAGRDAPLKLHPVRPGGDGEPVVAAPMIALVAPREEWAQLFDDAWRLFRDFFYDPGMHGLDWEAVGERYRAWLPDVASRQDLGFMIGEMIAELNVGHAHLGGGGPEEETPDLPAGLLGADLALDDGVYRVERVYRGPDWWLDHRSPLAAPGVAVEAGDVLLAVDGVPLDPDTDPWAPFVGLAGHEVVLTVAAGGADGERRDVVVELLDLGSDSRLRYLDWVEGNRRRVAAASGGRIGYLHIHDYGPFGLDFMVQQLLPQRDAAALIVDQRFNGGGWTPDRFLELLDRPPLMFRARRDGLDTPVPAFAHFGPKALLMNELSGSSADMFPWMFRERGLGPLIGTRTWGGVVGLSGNPALIDGQTMRIPNNGTYSADGRWIIEGWGVEPDIEVREDPSRMLAGEDPQLEAAIEVLLAALESAPPARPPRPPAPDRTGLGVPPIDR